MLLSVECKYVHQAPPPGPITIGTTVSSPSRSVVVVAIVVVVWRVENWDKVVGMNVPVKV